MLKKLRFGLVIVCFVLSFIYLLVPQARPRHSPRRCHSDKNPFLLGYSGFYETIFLQNLCCMLSGTGSLSTFATLANSDCKL